MCALLVASLLTAAAPQVEVERLDGPVVAGALAALDSQRVTVEAPDGRVWLATAELLQLVVKGPPVSLNQPPAAWIELVDGSSLIAVEFTVGGGQARVKLCGGAAIEVPTAALATVRFQEHSERTAAEWSRIVQMEHPTDVLVVRSNEVLNYHKGVLRDVSASAVQFELDGDVLPVKRSRVHGLVYYHPPGSSSPEPICRIFDVGGSQWSVRSLELADKLTWNTPGGLKLTQPISRVRRIDFSRGKRIFLSDLKPESVVFMPFFGTDDPLPLLAKFFGLREDGNLRSGPLQLGKTKYEKGLALHSRTRVVYRLPGRFRRFRATVGIDDGARPEGNVRLIISGDDRTLLQTTVTGADPPRPIDLDLSGVRRLAILADYGEDMDVADHLDLCEARILK